MRARIERRRIVTKYRLNMIEWSNYLTLFARRLVPCHSQCQQIESSDWLERLPAIYADVDPNLGCPGTQEPTSREAPQECSPQSQPCGMLRGRRSLDEA